MSTFGLLQAAADRAPDAGFRFLYRPGEEMQEVHLSYRELLQRSCGVAELLSETPERGPVALLYGHDPQFLVNLFGVLRANRAVVPLPDPSSIEARGSLDLVRSAMSQSRVAVCLLTAADQAGVASPSSVGVQVLAPQVGPVNSELDLAEVDGEAWGVPGSGDVCVIQFTSGSTSAPKGVLLTHANIEANLVAQRQIFGFRTSDSFLSWLPLFHDMGLIGVVLQAVSMAADCTLMRPTDFLRDPLSWLAALSETQSTVSGGPDFAFRRVVSACRGSGVTFDPRVLDLRSWRIAFNGSEPIGVHTAEAFESALNGSGFDGGAFCNCYGLAESSLIVSGQAPGAGVSAEESASVGSWAPLHEVRIVDPDTLAVVPDRQVGEVVVRGPSVAAGYLTGSPDPSPFDWRIDGSEGWLRTGDLGYVCEGDLYVVDRLKDLIVRRGKNVYPSDVERAAWGGSCVTDVRRIACVRWVPADSVGELVCVVVEVREFDRLERERLDEVGRRILSAVGRAGLPVDRIVAAAPGGIPLTTSGKMKRRSLAVAMSGPLPPEALEVWRSVGATVALPVESGK